MRQGLPVSLARSRCRCSRSRLTSNAPSPRSDETTTLRERERAVGVCVRRGLHVRKFIVTFYVPAPPPHAHGGGTWRPAPPAATTAHGRAGFVPSVILALARRPPAGSPHPWGGCRLGFISPVTLRCIARALLYYFITRLNILWDAQYSACQAQSDAGRCK